MMRCVRLDLASGGGAHCFLEHHQAVPLCLLVQPPIIGLPPAYRQVNDSTTIKNSILYNFMKEVS